MSHSFGEGVASPMAYYGGRPPPYSSTSSSSTTPPRHRATHACDRCRASRSKCSGEHRCSKCRTQDAVCAYSDRRRERNKKDLTEGVELIRHLERDKRSLIQALVEILNSAAQPEQLQNARDLLATISTDPQEEGSPSPRNATRGTMSTIAESTPGEGEPSFFGEKGVATEVGSPGKQSELQYVVHLDHGSGMTGYLGKMSEVSWMQRVREHLIGQPTAVGSDATPAQPDLSSAQAYDLTYSMDNENLLSVNEDDIDSQHLPPPATALFLYEAYFHALQGAFQFVIHGSFLRVLNQVSTVTHSTWAGRRAMGLANIIWAVGAKWLSDTKLDQHGFEENHLSYYARARALGLDHRILFDHPDMQMTQAIGVLAFYLMMNGSIQRAWSVLGQAIRHATALGLNLQIAQGVVEDSVRDDRAALIYSLYQLEVLLSEMTGRSMCIRTLDLTLQTAPRKPIDHWEHDSSIKAAARPDLGRVSSLWQSFLGLQRGVALNLSGGTTHWNRFVPVGSNVSPQHFTARLALSKISEETGAKLYFRSTEMTWSDYQHEMRALARKLQTWSESLLPDLRVDFEGDAIFDPRPRLELAMYHQSVRMILWRPCLCEITVEGESAASAHFNREGALACIQSAFDMMDTMPDAPTAAEILQILPWWPLVHYIYQAAAVLLLELSLNMQHMQGGTTIIILALRKATNHLWILAQHSKSAYKAWNIVRCLADKALGRYRTDLFSEVPTAAVKPWNWDNGDETRLAIVLQTLR